MNLLKTALVAVLVFSAPSFAADPVRPRLGVVVVVDQMRADYLERDPSFSGGFKRLAKEGAVFTDAKHLHIPTETGPGHAAISTGRAPATHGIVANDWYVRETWSDTYCVADDPYVLGPGHLDGPTLADAVKASDPAARVFSVSGKDRAAILLGGRRPDMALWVDKSKGIFTTSSYYRRPAWLDEFNAELVKSGLLTPKDGAVPPEVLASPALDEATARLVAEIVKRENVGRGPATDLLLVSFSATDLVGHRYGTEAPEMVAQLKALDLTLGRMLDLFQTASGGSLDLAFSADHGAIPSNEDPSGRKMGVRRFDWNAQGAAMENALQKRWPAGERWILGNSTPLVYLNRPLAQSKGLDFPAFARDAAKVIAGLDGIGRVIASVDVPTMDPKDPLASVLKRSYRPDRSGDLYVITAENVLLHDQPHGTSHGTPWAYDAAVPLVFWGRGVAAGRYASPATPMDIAPTMGRMLGVKYAPGDGGGVRLDVAAFPPASR
jgi:arylsulfatase A-like enzyme